MEALSPTSSAEPFLAESRESQTGPANVSLVPAASVISQHQHEPSASRFVTEFAELDLMPIRCYSCGKILRQLAIEEGIQSGQTLRETMDQLTYRRLCCRSVIMSSPRIVKIQKRFAREEQARIAFSNLTAEMTSGMNVQNFAVGPERISNISILDEAPPGVPQQTGICFAQMSDSFMDPDVPTVDAYEYHTRLTRADVPKSLWLGD